MLHTCANLPNPRLMPFASHIILQTAIDEMSELRAKYVFEIARLHREKVTPISKSPVARRVTCIFRGGAVFRDQDL